jgi:hypothetical protein
VSDDHPSVYEFEQHLLCSGLGFDYLNRISSKENLNGVGVVNARRKEKKNQYSTCVSHNSKVFFFYWLAAQSPSSLTKTMFFLKKPKRRWKN